MFTPKNDEEGVEVEKTHESKLEVQFLSFTTFYYMMFVAMSVFGTVFKGYFFAFHLLNIVNNNQLLRGVIQAVTQNGKSLVWVAILGLIIFYIYALVSFAMMRNSFAPDNHLYCATLWQCTITVIHYGLVGVLFDKVVNHPMDSTFEKFGFYVIYHLSFFIFITTIGLNIIFGIIVDTFSELRDLKWTAERDMRDTCFICSRGSYDFEHHGMLAQDKFDFFPLNRALSLSVMDEGSTDSKVDELLQFVMSLVERQKEEDAKNKREEERQKQLRWREENRNALLHPSQDGGDQGDGSQSNQSNSVGQLLRQKRWQHDIKDSKLVQSVDTQDSTAYVDHRNDQAAHHADDPFSQDDTQTGYTKTDTLPLDSRLEGLSRRSSPLSGAGWASGPRRRMYMSMEKRSDDAPVQSIEFDEDEDPPKMFASPVESHPKSSASPVESRGYTTIATGSSTRLTPVDHLDDYEHLPSSRPGPPRDSRQLLETDLRDVASKLHPESQERSQVSDPDQTPSAAYAGVSLPDFPMSYVPSPPSDHSSGSDVGPQSGSRHDTQTSDRRTSAIAPPSRRESFQSISGRPPMQSRRGAAEDFGMLTEDPFEITAPTAEFDEGLVRERRPSTAAPRHHDEHGSRSDSKPTDV